MSRNAIRVLLLFGVLTILGIFIIQSFFIYNAYHDENRKFDNTVRIVLQNVAEKISDYHESPLPYEKIIKRYASDYYLVNINTFIDVGVLEFYLVREFETHNLNIDFEYAIYDCSTDQMVYGNYFNLSDRNFQKTSLKTFPKWDDQVYYFAVFFPNHNKYIVNNLSVWYFITIILILVAVFFTYAIMVILKQKRLSDIQKDFIHNITHELKTPLTTISLSADVLAEEGAASEPERMLKYLSIIKEQTSHLHQQILKVLQFSGGESLRPQLKKSDIDLVAFVNEVVDNLEPRFKKENVTVTLHLPAHACLVKADALHLKNTLYNIIDNAIKYSEQAPELTISVVSDKKQYLFSLKDKGKGIEKKYLKRIFDKFFRVPTGNIHNVKGFGLGLAYVKNVARSHGWKIKLNSEPGKGTEVCLVLKKKLKARHEHENTTPYIVC